MIALRNVLSKTLYSLLSTGSTWVDRKRRVMAAKMLAATQKFNTNKQNQLKIRKETLISNFCCSCVRLLVHRITFNMLYENIRVKNVVHEDILSNSVKFWCLTLNSKKNSIKNNNIKTAPCPPPPPTHTHTHTNACKFSMLRVQYLDHRERVHISFIKK